ncbi:hypothetical protein ACUY3K_03515 [Corynebacterium uberis]|uniref:hypothetical protein n=1 Tax=Corynebacterium TaxID=1716 RepID=UPI001D0A3B87|nr:MULTISPECIES: hypothetical protein [Corynebacterium]MCZ9309340.1 hypothetical protein [Corynebacterium sp. c6VSa_13]UDL72889.1 hypothetical protein LH391_07145 [Corynebacterium uberis]UDL76234.1 hypothetical protein LH393_02250 [Corynebacterium uberis]UDL78446.1 hypothetical protein LH394_02240 [Corynebacterium uberis]UDL80729.1 hypothetical protein LH392_02670 [Corynebacterium uberis]
MISIGIWELVAVALVLAVIVAIVAAIVVLSRRSRERHHTRGEGAAGTGRLDGTA